ncbi:hypothetical protein J4205_04175 [Candidatus Pacearchaeota archaeon]|nr:hypothetical protein [Candidatus Pacearchaeota archaeon]
MNNKEKLTKYPEREKLFSGTWSSNVFAEAKRILILESLVSEYCGIEDENLKFTM